METALAGTVALAGMASGFGQSTERPPSQPQSHAGGADLTDLSLFEAAELVRKKKVSPVELTRACLARIEKLNPALNAFITITGDSALAEARQAEADIQRGKWRGPLHGIPIALKDLFDTAGVRTTAASALFKDRVPKEDAEVVRRLKAAGAVFLGKLNMQEFALGGTSTVSYFGAVHNPWKLSHIAGGSSGGSGAAVAAGLCFGALGSDTSGSIRQPSAYCGIVGLKPTYGLVSTRGVIPLSWSLDTVGPMTRTVADTAVMLQAIAGFDPEEPTSVEMKVPDYSAGLAVRTSGVRIGVVREYFFAEVDPEIEVAVNEAISVLGKMTAGVKEVTIPVNNDKLISTVEAYAYHADAIARTPELYQPESLPRLRAAAEISARTYIEARHKVAEVQRSSRKVFESVDLLVTPTTPIPPPAISEFGPDSAPLNLVTVRNTGPFNRNALPTISIPCGFTRAGFPIGLQISGPHGGEAAVLRLAHAFEQATEWHKRRPPAPEPVANG